MREIITNNGKLLCTASPRTLQNMQLERGVSTAASLQVPQQHVNLQHRFAQYKYSTAFYMEFGKWKQGVLFSLWFFLNNFLKLQLIILNDLLQFCFSPSLGINAAQNDHESRWERCRNSALSWWARCGQSSAYPDSLALCLSQADTCSTGCRAGLVHQHHQEPAHLLHRHFKYSLWSTKPKA